MAQVEVVIKGLHKRFPVIKGFRDILLHPRKREYIVALDGINLRIGNACCFCLLGPNGSGKTTLMKILGELVLPDRGEVLLNGCDILREKKSRRQIGFAVNDERSFYWRLSGRENLAFFARLNGIPPAEVSERVQQVLKLTNLSYAASQRFNTYSSGMRQLLSFARILLRDASLILVDEPTRGLDPTAADCVRRFLRIELVERQGKSVLWTTHDLGEAAEFGHELAIINKGRIRYQGKIRERFGNTYSSLRQIYLDSIGDNTSGSGVQPTYE